MKGRPFLVPEESIGCPDLVPLTGSQSEFYGFVGDRGEAESRIPPLLSEVHTHGIILNEEE